MMNRATRVGLLVLLAGAAAGCLYWPRETDVRTRPPTPVVAPQATADVPQIFIDMTTVRIPEAQVAEVLGDLCPLAAAQPRTLSKAERDALWKTIQDDERLRVVQAPKLLALDRQRATISIGETIRFASTKAETNGRGGLEFSIEEQDASPVFVGFRLWATPTIDSDSRGLTLDVRSLMREHKPGISHEEVTRMGAAAYLKSGIYEHKLASVFDMENDGHVLLGSPDIREDATGRHVQITLVHAKILKEADAARTSISDG